MGYDQIGDPEKVGGIIVDTIEKIEIPKRLLPGSDAVQNVHGNFGIGWLKSKDGKMEVMARIFFGKIENEKIKRVWRNITIRN